MNKSEKIKTFNQIAESAANLEQVARQAMALAARLKSEANSALAELGNDAGQTRKGKKGYEMPEHMRLAALGSLTSGKPLG